MDKRRTLRFQTPIMILSLVALVFTVLSCITYFVNYIWVYNDGKSFFELTVDFPDVFQLLSLLVSIAPYALLVIYLLKLHNAFKATVLVPVIFGLIAFSPLYYFIENLIYGYGINFGDLILEIPFTVAFALATVNAIKGFSKKIFLIIAIVTGLLIECLSIIDLFLTFGWYLDEGLHLYLFTRPIGALGTIALYVALLLFGLKNRIPAVLSVFPEKEKKNAAKMTPEQSLRLLNDKLELGMITEEAYRVQRAEIIDKL